MKVILNILAEDIHTSRYTDSEDCAMTRAFRRAGLSHFRETGGYIEDGNTYVIDTPLELKAKVIGMYKTKALENKTVGAYVAWEAVPIEDFQYELEIPN